MKTIERRFAAVRKRSVNFGDYPTPYKAVKCANFKKETISRWFTALVDKNEYEQSDRRELIRQLVEASNTPSKATEFN